MKAAPRLLIRYLLCLLAGAIFIGCPLSYYAWRWSVDPVSQPVIPTGGPPETPEYIDSRWPGRLVDPRTLPEVYDGSLIEAWSRAEYEARLLRILYIWIGTAGGFGIILLVFLISYRGKRGQASESAVVAQPHAR